MANHASSLSDEQTRQLEQMVQGLMIRVNAVGATRFDELLGALFNYGHGKCHDSSPIAKKQAGLEAVRQFCDKIEKWAGDPLRELSSAREFDNDDAVVRTALERLNNQSGLPAFNGYEKEIIRQHYLPKDAKSMAEFESYRIARRTFLGIYYPALALTARWAYGKFEDVDSIKPSPSQLKESQAVNESWQSQHAVRDLSTQNQLPEIRTQLDAAIKRQQKAIQDMADATDERKNKGEPSWQQVQNEQKDQKLFYMLTGAFSGALFFSSLVGQFIFAVSGAIEQDKKKEPTDKEKYDNNTAVLRSNILAATQNELLNGTDALLASAAQAYEQQQSHTQK